MSLMLCQRASQRKIRDCRLHSHKKKRQLTSSVQQVARKFPLPAHIKLEIKWTFAHLSPQARLNQNPHATARVRKERAAHAETEKAAHWERKTQVGTQAKVRAKDHPELVSILSLWCCSMGRTTRSEASEPQVERSALGALGAPVLDIKNANKLHDSA